MKHLLFTLILCSAAFVQQAVAFPPLLPIRAEIIDQQVAVSNTVPLDRPLAAALRKALTKIDATNPTNRVTGASAFGSIASTLSKSSLSNVFGPLFDTAMADFLNSIAADATAASNRLTATFPSGKRTAAQKKLALLFSQIASANANENIIAAARLMSQAARTYSVANSLVTKAENAPPGANSMTAKVNGAGFSSASRTTQASYEAALNRVTLNGVQGTKAITIFVSTTPGTHTHAIAPNTAIYSSGTQGQAVSTSGTITITLDTVRKVVYGTFSFEAESFSPLLGDVSVTDGTFFASYQ